MPLFKFKRHRQRFLVGVIEGANKDVYNIDKIG